MTYCIFHCDDKLYNLTHSYSAIDTAIIPVSIFTIAVLQKNKDRKHSECDDTLIV